jgi:hypothetical protein
MGAWIIGSDIPNNSRNSILGFHIRFARNFGVFRFNSTVLQASSTDATIKPVEKSLPPSFPVRTISGPMICPMAKARVIAAISTVAWLPATGLVSCKATSVIYLSTQGSALNDPAFINARDRIGSGPWQNAKGVVIAKSVKDLHSPNNKVTKETALDEKGQPINGRTDKPNMHDMLTGSRPDGTAFPGAPFADMTCGNWSKSGTDGSAMLGHHDRAGPIGASWASSWNSSHPTWGCNPEGLRSTGGNGLFYCFATK